MLCVSGAHKKFQPRVIRLQWRFCCGRLRRTPPFHAPPLRKKLSVERAGFERAFGFVLRANRINPSRIRCAQENFAGGIARDARDLRRAGLGEMGEDAVPIYGQESAPVAGPGQEPAIGSEAEGVDPIIARRPKLFRSASGADTVDAAGEERRKRNKSWLWWGRGLGRWGKAACPSRGRRARVLAVAARRRPSEARPRA